MAFVFYVVMDEVDLSFCNMLNTCSAYVSNDFDPFGFVSYTMQCTNNGRGGWLLEMIAYCLAELLYTPYWHFFPQKSHSTKISPVYH
jgi:hypothetical protein